mmetsp:Transcript_56850/g.146531  ORF Transcript_56850/g.146531 Transcript_56850/m.146531 type:complete len:311 (+) Transcript_56850:1166-2098(+)
MAASMASERRSLPWRTESMLAMSMPTASCMACLMAPSNSIFFCSFRNWLCASFKSGSPSNFADSAAAIASCKSTMLFCSQAAASKSRACCLGSSSCNTALASLICSASTPTSLACLMANFKSAIFLSCIATRNIASALSLDSAPASNSSNSTSSALFRPTRLAWTSATFSCSMSQTSRARESSSRACCFGSSSARTFLASSMYLEGTFVSCALAIAACKRPTSLSLIACLNFSRALSLAVSSCRTALASVKSASSAPAAIAALMVASSSPAAGLLSSSVASFANARWRSSTTSSSASGVASTVTWPTSSS